MPERWYCLKSLPKQEGTAQFTVAQLGYETFLPQCLVEIRQKSRGAPWRSLHRLVPLFSTYLFVKFDTDESNYRWPKIARSRGVVRILSSGPDSPLPLADDIIEALRIVSANAVQAPQAASLAIPIGTTCRVLEGPLAELEGVCAWSNERRVLLLMQWLAGERRVEVPRQFVEIVA